MQVTISISRDRADVFDTFLLLAVVTQTGVPASTKEEDPYTLHP
jgi:hypothetical protein